MKRSQKSVLLQLAVLVFVLAAVAVYYFIVLKPSEQRKAGAGKVSLLEGINRSDIVQLTVSYFDNTNHFKTVIQKDNGEWRISAPFLEKADDEAVSRILNSIQGVKSESILHGDASAYGFNNPNLILNLSTYNGKNLILTGGSIDATGSYEYALRAGDSNIYLVPAEAFQSMLLPTDAFRNRMPVWIAIKNLHNLDIKTGGLNYRIEQTDTQNQSFKMISPVKMDCDAMAVKSVILDLYTLSISEFTNKVPVEAKLENPRFSARLISWDFVTNELMIGGTNSSGYYYAKSPQINGYFLIEEPDFIKKFTLKPVQFSLQKESNINGD